MATNHNASGNGLSSLPESEVIDSMLGDLMDLVPHKPAPSPFAPARKGAGPLASLSVKQFFAGANWVNLPPVPPAAVATGKSQVLGGWTVTAFMKAVNWRNHEQASGAANSEPFKNTLALENLLAEFVWD